MNTGTLHIDQMPWCNRQLDSRSQSQSTSPRCKSDGLPAAASALREGGLQDQKVQPLTLSPYN